MKSYPQETKGIPLGDPLSKKPIKIPGVKWTLVIVPIAYIVMLLGISLFGLLKLSVFGDSGFTFEYITRFFTQKVYSEVLINTFKIAFYVTFFCLLLGYPVAYALTKIESRNWKSAIFGIILVSFWISLLVRTFTWMILLRSNGVVNSLLMGLGIIDKPIDLLYNTTGVVVGMVHILLPYMILSLYAVMESIDTRLLQAAQGLGARPWKAFIQVFFPLSLPGVLSGSLIVFVLGLGYFITPALLGGTENLMVSQLIHDQVNIVLNWNFAAAISIILLIVTLVFLSISAVITKKYTAIGGGN
ncbi:MAG TPA: ABC transporter permease [Bacillus sp. (in: firmicutes)]|nr:ABC transporter permease [Bacillus sp. (in: firmicutes)]